MNVDPLRFVMLEHRWNGVHWDLMLERNGHLRTWRLPRPITAVSTQIVQALADHRLNYLEYEGPISRDRGEVCRVAFGVYWAEIWADGEVKASLRGDHVNGKISLSRTGGGAWFLSFTPGNVD